MILRFLSSSPGRLCADSSEPGASFRFCVSSLSASPLFALSLKINKHEIKINQKKKKKLRGRLYMFLIQSSSESEYSLTPFTQSTQWLNTGNQEIHLPFTFSLLPPLTYVKMLLTPQLQLSSVTTCHAHLILLFVKSVTCLCLTKMIYRGSYHLIRKDYFKFLRVGC